MLNVNYISQKKPLSNLEIDYNLLILIQGMYLQKNPTGNIFDGKALDAFSQRWGQKCSASLLFSIAQEFLAGAINQENETKGIHTRKKDRKLSLFAGNMLIYIENPIEAMHSKAITTDK